MAVKNIIDKKLHAPITILSVLSGVVAGFFVINAFSILYLIMRPDSNSNMAVGLVVGWLIILMVILVFIWVLLVQAGIFLQKRLKKADPSYKIIPFAKKTIGIGFLISLTLTLVYFLIIITVDQSDSAKINPVDNATTDKLIQTTDYLQIYRLDYGQLPATLTSQYLVTNEVSSDISYKKISNDSFELCANFQESNIKQSYQNIYRHKSGKQCYIIDANGTINTVELVQ